MNDNKGLKILFWTIALLVMCNIGLILTIWLKPSHDGPPARETPRDYLIRNLKLTNEQVKKYDVLIDDHQQSMKKLRQEGGGFHQMLFAGLRNGCQGGTFADSVASLIANNQKQIEMVTYNHFAQVRALCTDEQKKEFDDIIVDVTSKMIGGPPPRAGQGPPPERRDVPPPNDISGPPPPPPPGR